MASKIALNPIAQTLLQSNLIRCRNSASSIHTNSFIKSFLDVSLLNKPQFDVQRRFLPKPIKSVQYKHDFRVLENKPYTADPLYVPAMNGKNPETGELTFN